MRWKKNNNKQWVVEPMGLMSNEPVIQVPLKLRSPDVPYRASVSSHAVLLPSAPSTRPMTAAAVDGRGQTVMKRPKAVISSGLIGMLNAARET